MIHTQSHAFTCLSLKPSHLPLLSEDELLVLILLLRLQSREGGFTSGSFIWSQNRHLVQMNCLLQVPVSLHEVQIGDLFDWMPCVVDDHRMLAPAKQRVHQRWIMARWTAKFLLFAWKSLLHSLLTSATTPRKGRNEGNSLVCWKPGVGDKWGGWWCLWHINK